MITTASIKASPPINLLKPGSISQNRVAIRIADGEFLDYLNACARPRTQTVKVELLVELWLPWRSGQS
jgi:hypothetical protein